MRVKIIKCSFPYYWYRNHIGEFFNAKPVRDGFMATDEFNGFICSIDCVSIEEIRQEKLEQLGI